MGAMASRLRCDGALSPGFEPVITFITSALYHRHRTVFAVYALLMIPIFAYLVSNILSSRKRELELGNPPYRLLFAHSPSLLSPRHPLTAHRLCSFPSLELVGFLKAPTVPPSPPTDYTQNGTIHEEKRLAYLMARACVFAVLLYFSGLGDGFGFGRCIVTLFC